MKSFRILLATVIMLASLTSFGQENESEVPGDNFSLEGALELFKKSESPEDFERLLNSPDSKVNNLDLNGDGYIDYIRVLDRSEKNVHVFILQAVIAEKEYQDIAVIELEKKANGKAVLQIVGDEDIYGIETIIEPTREVRTYAGTMSDPEVVNVWMWPSVQYVYSPAYSVWYSPWGWHSRPGWWRPWRPVTYVHYHSIWRPYRPYYAVCHTRRVVYAHHIYHPHRTTSVIVHNRHHDQLSRYRKVHHNDYRRSRSDERRAEMNNERSRQTDTQERNSRSNMRDTQTRSQIRETIDTDSRSRSLENQDARQRRITGEQSVPVKNGDDSGRLRKDNEVISGNENQTPQRQQIQRTESRERNVPAQLRDNSTRQKDENVQRRPATAPDREVRQPVTKPAENRSRSTESPRVQQRPTPVERAAPAQNNRNSGSVNRTERRERSAPAVQESRRQEPKPAPAPQKKRQTRDR